MNLKFIFFAFTFALLSFDSLAYAQQAADAANQVEAYKALCEKQRQDCEKRSAAAGGRGMEVCRNDYPICMEAAMKAGTNQGTKSNPASPPACSDSCEQQRLACQKTWAQTNSFGVPVTPPDKTKLCWDGYSACLQHDCGARY